MALLDALVGLKLAARQGNLYSLTPESEEFLVSSNPRYHGLIFEHHTQQLIPQWLQLREVVRTGKPAVRTNEEDPGGKHFAAFVESLFPLAQSAARKLGEHLGIPNTNAPVSVLDVGAGSGVWGIVMAGQSSQVRVTAVDWPAVLEVTKKVAARNGVSDRMTLVAGDFFEADFGKGHQVAVLGHILHSEGPERSQRLIRKIFDALAPGGTLAIQEFVPNEDRLGPPQPLIFAVNMLVNTQAGGTYTFSEMSSWMEAAGFTDITTLEAPGPSPLLLGKKKQNSSPSGR
jgi:2-polyprenyl-3-methyl-5-hydroxy-6-metoxy-1,4-benzoquinol methylase